MDLTGVHWGLAAAEAVLRLRALRASGDSEVYWRFHETSATTPAATRSTNCWSFNAPSPIFDVATSA